MDIFRHKKIVITGGLGFIGSNIIPIAGRLGKGGECL
jgi:nucleoside-diphosphate-sugar epimerase